MSKSKKITTGSPILPVKTKETYVIAGKNIPVYAFPDGTPVNADEYMFCNVKSIKGKSLVLRKMDLIPKPFSKNLQLLKSYKFGYTLIDTFTPIYGFFEPTVPGRFYFVLSNVRFTSNSGWALSIDTISPHEFFDPSLSFKVGSYDISNPHIKVSIFDVEFAPKPKILTITTSINTFTVFIGAVQEASFHLLLQPLEDSITITLKRSNNGPDVSCHIHSVELYSTIFLDGIDILST
jgi:hypothetical protein